MSRYTQEYEGRHWRPHTPSALSIATGGLTLLGGLALGAGVMYLLDPEEGHRRRKYIRRTASNKLQSAGDMLGSAYESVAGSASSLRERASDLTDSAGHFLRRPRERAREYIDEYTGEEDKGLGWGSIVPLVLGGSALAAAIYVLTTEYDSIRQGQFRRAASHAYHRASDAITSGAEYVRDTASRAGEQLKGDRERQPEQRVEQQF